MEEPVPGTDTGVQINNPAQSSLPPKAHRKIVILDVTLIVLIFCVISIVVLTIKQSNVGKVAQQPTPVVNKKTQTTSFNEITFFGPGKIRWKIIAVFLSKNNCT